jgi:hypothetical protein
VYELIVSETIVFVKEQGSNCRGICSASLQCEHRWQFVQHNYSQWYPDDSHAEKQRKADPIETNPPANEDKIEKTY